VSRRHEGRSWTKTHRSGSTLVVVVITATVGLIAGMGYLAWSSTRSVKVSAENLCPAESPPADITVFILDMSDALSEAQRLKLGTDLKKIHREIPRFGLLELYAVGTTPGQVIRPVLSVCNPGDGSDLNQLYENPTLARRKWMAFQQKIDAELDKLMSDSGGNESPIMEAIQSTALRSFGPMEGASRRKLVIVSDLLQNVPGELSHYDGVPDFAAFKESAYFSRVRGDLSNVEVFVHYLVRPNSPQKWPEHRLFWEQYFAAQGATVEQIEPVYGAK
jgi:hypothetical protein